MSDYLPPEELLVEILSRLPVKSLLRFISVSKPWRSLITSPTFINTHLNQSVGNSHLLLLRYGSLNPQQEHYSLRFDDELFARYAEFKCPVQTRFYFRVVGTCNGLVCLSSDLFGDNRTIILWNPLIRRYVRLPARSITPDSSVIGFGFDPRTHDFKVVSIGFVHPQDKGRPSPSAAVISMIEVYSLKTGSWKAVTCGVPSGYTIALYFWDHVFLNGAAHWLAYRRVGIIEYLMVLLTFGMDDEVFRVIGLPGSLAPGKAFPFSVRVQLVGNMIGVTDYGMPESFSCSVWMMKEYGVVKSWTKLYKVAIRAGLRSVFGFRKSGEVLMKERNGDLVSYHPGFKLGEKLGMRSVGNSAHASTFVESLVLLDGSMNGIGPPVGGGVEEGEEANEAAVEIFLHNAFMISGSGISSAEILGR